MSEHESRATDDRGAGDAVDFEVKVGFARMLAGGVIIDVTSADEARAQDELGYRASVGIEEGVRRFVAWYRETVE